MELSPLLLEKTVRAALEEDLGHGHDITSKAVVAPGTQARAVLMARKSGVLAGTGPAILAFALCMPDAVIGGKVAKQTQQQRHAQQEHRQIHATHPVHGAAP